MHCYSLLQAASAVAKRILKADRTERSDISLSNILTDRKRHRVASANSSMDKSSESLEEDYDDDDDDDLLDDVFFNVLKDEDQSPLPNTSSTSTSTDNGIFA